MPHSTLLFEQNPNPMFVFDRETHKIEEVNQSAIEKYGYSADEFRELRIEDIRPEEDVPNLRRALTTLSLEDDPQVIGTHRHITKDGEIFHARITTQPASPEGESKWIAHIFDVSEIVEVKQGYREASLELKNHIDANPLAFIKFDEAFNISQWSSSARKLFDYSEHEMIGKNPLETGFIVEKEKERLAERMNRVKERKEPLKPFETEVQVRGGKQLDIRFHTSVVRNEDGSMKSVVSFLEDISEEKEYQHKLEEEQKRMERAQNLARLGWWTYDVQEDKLIWSDVLYKILGIDKKRFEATLQAFHAMVHPDDRSKLEKVMCQAREAEQAFDYRLRIINRKDEVIHTQCRAQSTFDQEDNLVQLSGVLQDITKRVKAKKELEKNKKLFENLFLQSPVAMALISTDKIVQKVNQSFVDLFGYTREEIVGENLLTHLLPESDQRKIDRLYKNALSGQKRYYEDVRVTKDGKKINLFVGALPVKLNNEVIAAFGIYVDITQLKMTESQLKHSLEEKEILLSEIHHRVKNNLAIISGLLELEGMNWENEQVKSAFTESQLRIRSMAMIHEKLYQTDDFANLQFENYIGELVEIITSTLNRNNKQISTTIEADDINLNINQALPCALIINELVTNAIKHGFEGREQGNVKVLMKEEADTVNIQVKDDGKGLPEEKQDLFDSSLGLTLVKQLAKQLNTEIKTGNSGGASFELSFQKRSTSGSGSNYFI